MMATPVAQAASGKILHETAATEGIALGAGATVVVEERDVSVDAIVKVDDCAGIDFPLSPPQAMPRPTDSPTNAAAVNRHMLVSSSQKVSSALLVVRFDRKASKAPGSAAFPVQKPSRKRRCWILRCSLGWR